MTTTGQEVWSHEALGRLEEVCKTDDVPGLRDILTHVPDLNLDIPVSYLTGERDSEKTILMLAAECGSNGVVAELISLGARLDIGEEGGRLAVTFAAYYSPNARTLQLLLAAGGAFQTRSMLNALLLSLFFEGKNRGGAGEDVFLEKLMVLVAAGADPARADRGGVAPIYCACAQGLLKVALWLFQEGADPFRETSAGMTAAESALPRAVREGKVMERDARRLRRIFASRRKEDVRDE